MNLVIEREFYGRGFRYGSSHLFEPLNTVSPRSSILESSGKRNISVKHFICWFFDLSDKIASVWKK